MAFFLFIDESGQDHHDSPYEVLAGIAIDDKNLWNFIRCAHELEIDCFGRKYREKDNEIKARTFLNRKTFRLASQLPAITLDKSASHLLLDQMDKYFKKTTKGRYRAGLIIPEPFFVHSELTTGIQVVDFVAYIMSWNFRVGKLHKAPREELKKYLELIKPLRYRTTREIGDITEYVVWSIVVV